MGIHPHAEFFLIAHIVLFSVLFVINNRTLNANLPLNAIPLPEFSILK